MRSVKPETENITLSGGKGAIPTLRSFHKQRAEKPFLEVALKVPPVIVGIQEGIDTLLRGLRQSVERIHFVNLTQFASDPAILPAEALGRQVNRVCTFDEE
jgi:hypothetical protein